MVIYAEDGAEDACARPPDTEADCEGAKETPATMWYYNVTVGDCFSFNYYGCQLGVNKFPDQDTCKETCNPPPSTDEDSEDNKGERDKRKRGKGRKKGKRKGRKDKTTRQPKEGERSREE